MSVGSVKSSSSSRKREVESSEKPKTSEAPKEQKKDNTSKLAATKDTFEPDGASAKVALSETTRRANVDPRVAARVRVEASPVQGNGQGQMVVDTVAFQPPGSGPGQSQGRHNVYVQIAGPDGKPLPREEVEKYFTVEYVPAAGAQPIQASGKFGDAYGVASGEWQPGGAGGPPTEAYFTADLYKGYAAEVWVRPNPNVPDNPYAGYGSQKVGPFTMEMGNPAEGTNGEHVNYLVTFRMQPGAGAQEPTVPQPEVQEPAPPDVAEPPVVTPPTEPARPTEGGPFAPGSTLRVTATAGLNVRAAPGIDGERTGGVAYDTRLTVTPPPDGGPAVNGNWVHVSTPSGTQGWVNTGFVEPSSAAPVQPAPVQPGGQVPVPLPAGAPGSPFGVPYEVVPGLSVNGRLGVHWPVAFNPHDSGDMAQVGPIIDKMKAMGAGFTTLNVFPDQVEAMKPVFDALNAAGISPVVRLYQPGAPDTWSNEDIDRMANAAVKLGENGVHFVQIGNEPNIETSLDGSGANKDANLRASVSRMVDAMVAVQRKLDETGQSANVKVALPPMAAGAGDHAPNAWSPETYYKALLHEVADREASLQPPRRLVDWISTHPYVYEDGANTGMEPGSGGARGMMGWGPDTGRWYEAWAANILGYAPRALSTEAGAVPDAFRHGDQDRVAREMQTTLDQLRGNSNTTACLWLEWESQPGSNNWDRSVLDPRDGGDAAWGKALPSLRDAARSGQ
ncbi:MAG TPA: SH3 domain-containing protein [Myxococcaceae bacterium]|nr:SH3 domain-containing protein [Myxococcaceae bacterium]